ncbi:MAG: Vitamin epoxide reductase [Frankiales bacterium]|nr:Vitamin epoxide reductase [Frankiales bacterium]
MTATRVRSAAETSAFALSAAGLAVSGYLTYTHFTDAPLLACPEGSFVNCATVTSSAQSMLFGVVPVALAGLTFYAAMLALTVPAAWRRTGGTARRLRVGAVALGVGMVLYLLWAELHVVRALCLWCTVVHVTTFALFLVVGYHEAARATPVTRQARRRSSR